MKICRMNYNDLSGNGRNAKFHCYGVEIFDVFPVKIHASPGLKEKSKWMLILEVEIY
ncbi:hypothetical protein [Photorhabdus bodei]|uniref:Uncharacterized protein n=1 Tax=Photorhabdus bodei TaxID=2029681 RepID=A0ABX0AGJ6_9GAMM|nr:hypothetical protein [Photorhabdus bodei]NDL02105.1 hypothetical protein [Photorhabdus bodei]NDL06179.1 hypothetical protein [Photorhabdus bodei]